MRTLVRCSAFGTALVLLGLGATAAMVVPAVSPLVMIATAIATRTVASATLIGLPVLLVVLVRRRWFCRWLCPVGLLTECAGRLSPVNAARCRPVPAVGKGIVLASLSAAAVGYPLLLWLDPLAFFSGSFSLTHEHLGLSGWVAVGTLACVLLLSAALPGVWCLKLCPLGATQELLAVPARVLFRRKSNSTSADAEDPVIGPLPRRSLLAMAAGAACVALGAPLGWTARARGQRRCASVLRPPGAVADWQFSQLCLRCGNCGRACPAGIIRPDRQPATIAAWLAPVISIEEDYCREDCSDCMQVCPSGAIEPGDLETKRRRPIGLARVDMDRCLLALDRECRTMCLEVCPYEAIRLHEWTWEDDRRYPIVEASKCPGCGACLLACTPMDAITILPPGSTSPALANRIARR